MKKGPAKGPDPAQEASNVDEKVAAKGQNLVAKGQNLVAKGLERKV